MSHSMSLCMYISASPFNLTSPMVVRRYVFITTYGLFTFYTSDQLGTSNLDNLVDVWEKICVYERQHNKQGLKHLCGGGILLPLNPPARGALCPVTGEMKGYHHRLLEILLAHYL